MFSRKRQLGSIIFGWDLSDIPTHEPTFHVVTESKAPWNEIRDHLKQFEKGPVKP
ncbi:hypothetical protein [Vibrio ostreicida]|uniref:hypothetical protein n=1 Tax=Vibrio ostreicida TaxID=526588 RepID=UPI00387E3537